MSGEKWTTTREIKRRFIFTESKESGAGPILHVESGRKYTDDGESHIAVIGKTGKGKSQTCSLPFIREIFKHRESAVILDPKMECYYKNACWIPHDYQVFCVDFRNPGSSPTQWNPLTAPYRLYSSDSGFERDISSSMLSELWAGVYPTSSHADRFWTDAAVAYAKGLTYSIFDNLEQEQINLETISAMMEQSEKRIGMHPIIKSYHEALKDNSLAKRNLATYASAPNETRACIHSTALTGIEVFSRSAGLMNMLSKDTLNILDMDTKRPFALFIILPDETDVYDALAGLLVSQLSQHLIRVAQELGGKLPIRVNIILEELGSVGRSIPNLANLMVAGRSRNLRLMLVLQSNSQLIDVYGKSKAETINSCIGITIGFSTNSWDTLVEWSRFCGEKHYRLGGNVIKEPLITPAQLAAMPIGTALIMVDGRYKFITNLPLYDEMYDNSQWQAPQCNSAIRPNDLELFDFMKHLEQIKSTEKQKPDHRIISKQTAFHPEGHTDFNQLSAMLEHNSFSFAEIHAHLDEALTDAEKNG